MAIAREPYKLTYHDYLLLPDEKRVELIDGDFLMTPAPTPKHQKILQEIFVQIDSWVKQKDLGQVYLAPTDVYLSEHDVVQPDILFIAKNRLGIIRETHIQGPPDLALEVVSPGSEKRDLEIKKHLYSKFGIREYWIVDLKSATITVLTFQETGLKVKQAYPAGATAESSIIPGFCLTTRELF